MKITIPNIIAVLNPALKISPTNSQELIDTSNNNRTAKGKLNFFMQTDFAEVIFKHHAIGPVGFHSFE